MKRVALALVAVVAGGLFGATLGSGPAGAVDPDCKTVVTNIVNRPDNGHGTGGGGPSGGWWADVTGTRTVKVCVVPQPQPELSASVEVQGALFEATVVDTGTLVTRGGNTLSPNKGVKLKSGVKGTWNGGFSATFWAPAPTSPDVWPNWTPGNIPATVTGASAPTTGNWVKSLWTGADLKSEDWTAKYSWTYVTCNEKWVDAYNNGDGTNPGAGDITGYSKDYGKCVNVSFVDKCDSVDVKIVNNFPTVEKLKFTINGADYWVAYGETKTINTKLNGRDQVRVELHGARDWLHKCVKLPGCPTPTPTATATPTPAPTTPAATTPVPTTTTTPAVVPIVNGNLAVTGTSGGNPVPWLMGGGAGLILLGAALLFLIRKNRRDSLPTLVTDEDPGDMVTFVRAH